MIFKLTDSDRARAATHSSAHPERHVGTFLSLAQKRRRGALGAGLLLLPPLSMLGMPAYVMAPASAEPKCSVPASGDLTIHDLPEGSSVIDCKAQGRDVVAAGLQVPIPAVGEGVSMEIISPTNATTFTIRVSPDGIIDYDLDTSAAGDGQAVSTSSRPPECDQDAFNLKDERHNDTWNWYVGDGSYPAALTYDAFVDVARTSLASIKNSFNNCGYRDKVSQFVTSFKGKTANESDFVIEGGDSKCGPRDGVSTLDAGNLDKSGDPPLASECTWTKFESGYDDVLESDIRFNITDFNFTTTPGASDCNLSNKKWDVQSLLTHELGHTAGLGHVSEDSYPWMTMSTGLLHCDSSARTLGKGDIFALQYLYCLNDNCHYVEG